MDLSIDTLEKTLRANLDSSAPLLSGTPVARGAYQKMLSGILDAASFSVASPEIVREKQSLWISGSASVLGFERLELALGFQSTMDMLGFSLQAHLPEMPGPDWISDHITDPTCNLQFGPLAQTEEEALLLSAVMRVSYTASLQTGRLTLPLNITPAVPGRSPWHLRASGIKAPLAHLADLADWLGMDKLVNQVPADLRSLGGLYVSDLDVTLNDDASEIESASVTLGTAASWSIVDDRIELNQISLSIHTNRQGAAGERNTTVDISARLEFGSQSLAVSVFFNGANRLLITLLPATDLQLPSFADLEKLVGVFNLSSALPREVAELKGLGLTGLAVEIDTTGPTIKKLDASLHITVPIQIGNVADLRDSTLALMIEPAKKNPFTARLNGQFTFNDQQIPASGIFDQTLTLRGSINSFDIFEALSALLPGLPPAIKNAKLNFTGVNLLASTDGILQFTSSVSTDFRSLADALGIPLPESLATLQLDRLALSIDQQAGSWSIGLATPLTLRLPARGKHFFEVSGIQIDVSKNGQITQVECGFTLGGQVVLSPDLSFAAKNVTCRWKSGEDNAWSCDGAIEATIHQKNYRFEAFIEKEGESSRFGMKYNKAIGVSSWPEIAAVQLRGLEVALSKEAEKKRYSWSLKGQSTVDIMNGLIVGEGQAEMAGGALEITATVSNAPAIPLEGIPGNPEIALTLDPISFKIGDESGAALKAGVQATIKDIPKPADVVFPDGTMNGSLQLDDKGLSFRLKPLVDPELAISFLGIDFPKISAGDFVLQQIKNKTTGKRKWQLGAQLNVKGLAQLNRLFGNAALFEDRVDLLCALGNGLTLSLAGPLPFKGIPLRPQQEDGSYWTEWTELRDTGKFSFRVPDFGFDFSGGRWHASGGAESQKELTLPLGILKRAIDQLGLPNPLAMMPDRIPLAEIDLKSDGLYKQFELVFGKLDASASAILKKITDVLREGLDRIPENMDEYLTLSVPTEFTFDIAVEPSGGYSIGLRTEGAPLKVLLPLMSPTGPGLLGITLHYLSFGLSAGGSMAVVKCDAYFDQFDGINLIYALATGEGRAISNRLEMRNTTAVIPVAAPFPIPLFYERFGWSYRDLLGIEMKAHAGFGPLEPPPLSDWFTLMQNLFSFGTQKGYYLHEHEIPESMQLPFSLEPTFFALPSYLGGTTLGLRQGLSTLPVATTLAKMLDGIKTGNIGWMIQSVPLRYPDKPGGDWIRIGNETIHFGPLEISAAWCITTSDEFQEIILQDAEATAMLAGANSEEMLTCLPEHYGGASYDKGFVILLMGGLTASSPLGDIFHFKSQFGMASMGPRDFETAVRLRGGFGPRGMLELGIEGRIKVDSPAEYPDQSRILVAGEIYLLVAQQKFALGGMIEIVTGVSFAAEIRLDLSNHLSVSGRLFVSKEETRIDGTLKLADATYSTAAIFNKEGITFEAIKIKVGELTASASLMLPGRNEAAFSLWAGVELPSSFTEEFKKSLVDTANTEVSEAINDAYNQFESYTSQVNTFEASLRGLQGWLPGFCDKVTKTIDKNTTNAKVEAAMWKWAGKNLGRKIAVRTAISTSNPGKTARNSAAPWKTKLKNVKTAAEKPIDQQYRAGLQTALSKLLESNTINVYIKVAGKNIRVYQYKNVLSSEQRAEIQKAIEYIGKLPEASKQKVHFKSILDKAPREQLLSQVRNEIEKGMDSIPTVHSAGFEASLGFNASSLTLIINATYNGESKEIEVPTNLSRPAQIPIDVTSAFVKAFG